MCETVDNKTNDSIINISTSSFIAKKLLYLDSKTISESSKTIFLGKYPKKWLSSRETKFLLNFLVKGINNLNLDETIEYMKIFTSGFVIKKKKKKTSNVLSTYNIDKFLEEIVFKNALNIVDNDQNQNNLNKIFDFYSNFNDEKKILFSKSNLHLSFITKKLISGYNKKLTLKLFNKLLKKYQNYFIFNIKAKNILDFVNPRSENEKELSKTAECYANNNFFIYEKMLILNLSSEKHPIKTVFKMDVNDIKILKEHYVVIINLRNDLSCFLFQLHEISKFKPNFKDPLISLKLNKDSVAEIFNNNDKSFYLIIPNDGIHHKFILQAQDLITNFKWLYIIKKILGISFTNSFFINIHGLSIFSKINLTELDLKNIIKDEKSLEIQKLLTGYKVKNSYLLNYLKNSTLKKLIDQKSFKFCDWIQKNEMPWFCFKIYDRIEWVKDDGLFFFISNQLLKQDYQLQFRNIKNQNDEAQIKPTPIEGFVIKLNFGLDSNGLKFKKIYEPLFLHTCENIIFFTKYRNAIPPFPSDFFFNKNFSLKEIPSVYINSPFSLNENQHITWLENKKYKNYDNLACLDYKRRSLNIVNSITLLDLNSIKVIKKFLNKQNYDWKDCDHFFPNSFWPFYKSSSKTDNIIDSIFEIELINGKIILLKAPNKKVRDEWILNLIKLKEYWDIKNNQNILTILNNRSINLKVLRINEFIDSNINQETNPIETINAKSMSNLYTINSIVDLDLIFMSGYLHMKFFFHSTFKKCFSILCPEFIVIYFDSNLNKNSHLLKKSIVIPISKCYIYSGNLTLVDLFQENKKKIKVNNTPKLYLDGWKSSEEDHLTCFTLWIQKKKRNVKNKKSNTHDIKLFEQLKEKSKKITNVKKKINGLGKKIIFKARSRQEKEMWIYNISNQINQSKKN